MTIQYDHQIFCEQQFGGISRYFYELIKGASQIEGIKTILDVKYSDNVFLQKLQPDNSWLTHAKFKGKRDLVRFINYYNTKLATRKNKFDIFHPTYFNSSCIQNSHGKPMVITVLDLIDEKYHVKNPEFSSLIKHRKKTIGAAQYIIAISENTKKDIIDYFGIAPEKVKVTYLGNSLEPAEIASFEKTTTNHSPYLLYIGSRKGLHKNFENFMLAMGEVLKSEKEISLVFGGGGAFTPEEKKLFDKLSIHQRVFQVPIMNDSVLIGLYKNASLFIYPSLYEGFGLPILEAFSCGTACVISKGSSIEEVGLNAAAYFDPTSPEEMAKEILHLYKNQKLQSELIAAGLLRSKDFNWQNTVKETLATYQLLI